MDGTTSLGTKAVRVHPAVATKAVPTRSSGRRSLLVEVYGASVKKVKAGGVSITNKKHAAGGDVPT